MMTALGDSVEIILSILSVVILGKKLLPYLKPSIKSLLWGLGLAVLLTCILFLLSLTSVGSTTLAPFTEQNIATGSIPFLILYAIALVFSEELFFRIYLGQKLPVVLTALIFSASHWRPDDFPILMFPLLFIFALAQSALLRKTGSLWSVVLSHLAALCTLVVLYG